MKRMNRKLLLISLTLAGLLNASIATAEDFSMVDQTANGVAAESAGLPHSNVSISVQEISARERLIYELELEKKIVELQKSIKEAKSVKKKTNEGSGKMSDLVSATAPTNFPMIPPVQPNITPPSDFGFPMIPIKKTEPKLVSIFGRTSDLTAEIAYDNAIYTVQSNSTISIDGWHVNQIQPNFVVLRKGAKTKVLSQSFGNASATTQKKDAI